jgi:pimeloyl-ACP methyl ester carboxylesterase
MMCDTDPKGAAAALRGRAERPPYDATLAELTVPALIVVGARDQFTTLAEAEKMRDLLVRSELVVMDGIGHMPNLEAGDSFNAAVVSFLTRCTASSPEPDGSARAHSMEGIARQRSRAG